MTVEYEDTTTCNQGHEGARRAVVQTLVTDTKPAALIDCDECDRAKCYTCKKPLTDRRAVFCPCGGQTWPRPGQQ